MGNRRTGTAGLLAAAAVGAIGAMATASPVAWDNTAPDFNADSSWSGGTAPADDLVSDVGTFAGTPANQPDLSAGRQIAGLDFQSDGWTLSGTGFTLTLGSSGVSTSTGAVTISAPLNLGTSQIWTIGGSSLVLGGGLSGTGVTLTKAGAGTLTFGTSGIQVSGGVVVNEGTVRWAGNGTTGVNNTFTGVTVNAGTFLLGDNPLSVSAGAIVVSSGGTFSGGSTGSNNFGSNRLLSDNKAIILNGGTFSYSSQKGSTENVGTLTLGAGASLITLTEGQTGGTTGLKPDSLTRTNRGTLLVRGAALGTTATTGQRATQLTFDTVPTAQLVGGTGTTAGSLDLPILPFVLTDTSTNGTAYSLATYANGLSGIRPLNTGTEYAAFAAAGATDNVRATEAFATSSKAVNALVLSDGSGSGYTVDNSGNTLTVGSGVMLLTRTAGAGGVTVSGGTLDFGGREAIVYSTGAATDTLATALVNADGLTKSGTGTLQLNGTADVGDVVINEGTLGGTGTLVYRIAGTTADLITVNKGGSLDITGLQMAVSADELQTMDYVIADYNGGSLIGTSLAVTGLGSGVAYSLDTTAGLNDRQIVLSVTATPEPGTAGLIGLAAGTLLRRRRAAGR